MIKKLQLIAVMLLLGSFVTYAQVMNEAQGTGFGVSITSGDYNTHYGDSSGYSLSSGSYTTFIGYLAGKSHMTQFDNTFVGARAGEFSISGTDNTFLGKDAGRYCDGTDNTVIGTEAGMAMVSGASDNTIVGEEAGQALIDGDDNVFIGEDAGYNSTTSSDNTFVGNTSGRSNTTGFANAFFGDEAGYDNTTGQWNSALGDSALIDNGVGFNNTAVGHGAGCATEHGDYNTFMGTYAGGDNNRNNNTSNANRNTYVGVFAGYSNRAGEDNVGMGAFSGYGGTYDYTRAKPLGQWNGTGNSTNRSRTTFLGAQTAARNNDVIAIGYKARVDGQYGITLGNESRAEKNYAVAIGQGVHVNQLNTMALGGDALANRLSVGIGTVAANQNASLELADVDKGFLINRLTTAERTTMITTPASGVALTTTDEGLMVYDTDDQTLYVWDGAAWAAFTTGSSGSDDQALSLNVNSLELEDGGNVDLAPYLDNTDDQGADVFQLNVNNLELSLEDDGVATQSVDLSGYLDNTDDQGADVFQLNGDDLELSLEDDGVATQTVDLSGYLDNTDDQGADVFQLNGDDLELSLEDDGVATQTVDLSGYLDNTDDQGADVFQLNGDDLELSLEDDGVATQTVDLSGYLDNTDTQNISGSGLAGNILTIGIENGTSEAVDLSSLNDSGTDDQQMSLSGNSLDLEDGGSVNLSGYLDNTDAQNISGSGLAGNNLTIGIENGASEVVDLSSLNDSGTDDQQMSLSGNSLDLEDGGSVNLAGYLDNTDAQNISGSGLAGNILTIGIENGASEVVDLSSLNDSGTDDQQMSLSGNSLDLEDGGSVSLSGYLDNTDAQNISGSGLAGNILTIGIENGASEAVDLSSIVDSGTDDQQMSLSGNSLDLEDGGSVDLAGYLDNTDAQNISGSGLAGTILTIGIENGVSENIDLSSLSDSGTDDQQLTLAGNNLDLEDGGSVDLSGYLDNTDNQEIAILEFDSPNLKIEIEGGNVISVDISSLISDLQDENDAQQAQIDDLIARMEIQEDCACDPLGVDDFNLQPDRAYLLQNVPNPFNNTTAVGYFVPFSYLKANIIISNINGQILENINLSQFGEGTITIDKGRMASATYLYTLFVDGKKVDTRRMVVD